jgi:FkbM family methyltransferase
MSEIDRYETLFGPMFHYMDDEVIGRSLQRYGQWALDEIALIADIMRREPPGDFLDIGANVGAHTVGVATLFPATEVFAFEANPRTFQLLCANITANGLRNVRALGHLVGEVSCMTRTVSSFADAGRNLGAVGFQTVPIETKSGELMLQVAIDDVHPPAGRVAFVKADVEGMEAKALRGARALLERWTPAIYFENGAQADSGPLFDDLAALGYETFWHINFPFDDRNYGGDPQNVFGGSVEIGTLCLHRASHSLAEIAAHLAPTARPIDSAAWERCVALNARLRDELRASLHGNDRAAWLRGELLRRRAGGPDETQTGGAPHEGATDDRAMPSFAEIRRATLLDIPGNALRPLLEPYVAAAPLDEAAYLRRYPDVAEAVATRRIDSAREHYVRAGYFEGREG